MGTFTFRLPDIGEGIAAAEIVAWHVAIGDRVAMTFRRLFTADGIHDYFWKGRPIRSATSTEEA